MDRPTINRSYSNNTKYIPITSLNGPVSLVIMTNGSKTLYLMGDMHESKAGGCSGVCVSTNDSASNLINTNSSCMDLDAALHTWLLYNKQEGIETDMFYEHAFIPKTTQHRKRGTVKKVDRYGQADWLFTLGYLFNPCEERKYCVYSPTVRIE